MSKSYFPTKRAGQIDWYNNFAAEFPKVAEKLGFSPPEITNAVNDSRYAIYLLETLGPEIESESWHTANAVLEGQPQGKPLDLHTSSSSTAAPTAVPPGIDTRRQARAERIKKQTGYADAIGQQLKIVSANFDAEKYQAELGQPYQSAPNMVTIPFRKAGGEVSGINLYVQGKGEGAPKLVGFFMRTPAVDNTPGQPGERTYTARAVIDGKEVGQASGAVKVGAG